MSADPAIDATDPAELLKHVEATKNSVVAARLGDPPDGQVAGMSPVGIESGGQVCTPQQSVLGMSLVEALGPAAVLPPVKSDFAATFGSNEPLTPAVNHTQEFTS